LNVRFDILGLGGRRVAVSDFAVPIDKEFGEVPLDRRQPHQSRSFLLYISQNDLLGLIHELLEKRVTKIRY